MWIITCRSEKLNQLLVFRSDHFVDDEEFRIWNSLEKNSDLVLVSQTQISEIPFINPTEVEFVDKSPGSTGLSHEGVYTYLGEVQVKDSSKNWSPGVIYERGGNQYVRLKESFIEKFKLHTKPL